MESNSAMSRYRFPLWKIAIPFLFVLSMASAQTRFGSLEIPHIYSNEIQIRQGSHESRIDLTNLIRVNDCYTPAPGICTGPPRSPCPECPKLVGIVAWDEHRQKLYFGIGTGGWQERPWTIFNYNLATHRITRFMSTDATAIGRQGVVSSSGQYLVYVKVYHCSPGAQGLCTSDGVGVMDLWNRRIAELPSDVTPFHDVIRIKHLTWSSPSKIDYTGVAQSFKPGPDKPVPEPERPTQGSIDVRSLQFR
jgi:hypothetical protein